MQKWALDWVRHWDQLERVRCDRSCGHLAFMSLYTILSESEIWPRAAQILKFLHLLYILEVLRLILHRNTSMKRKNQKKKVRTGGHIQFDVTSDTQFFSAPRYHITLVANCNQFWDLRWRHFAIINHFPKVDRCLLFSTTSIQKYLIYFTILLCVVDNCSISYHLILCESQLDVWHSPCIIFVKWASPPN